MLQMSNDMMFSCGALVSNGKLTLRRINSLLQVAELPNSFFVCTSPLLGTKLVHTVFIYFFLILFWLFFGCCWEFFYDYLANLVSICLFRSVVELTRNVYCPLAHPKWIEMALAHTNIKAAGNKLFCQLNTIPNKIFD